MDISKLKADPWPSSSVPSAEKRRLLQQELECLYRYLGNYFPEKDEDNFWAFVNTLNSNKLFRLLNTINFLDYSKGHIKQDDTVLMTLVLISVIEGVQQEEDYLPFQDWLLQNEREKNFQEAVEKGKLQNLIGVKDFFKALKKTYLDKYGAGKKCVTFFKQYLDGDDKFRIIRGYRFKLKGDFYPLCFNNCKLEYGECSDSFCRLRNDLEGVDKNLEKVVRELYNRRSYVVHNATLIYLSSENKPDHIGIMDVNLRKPTEGAMFITLKYKEMEEIVLKAIVKFYLKQGKVVGENM